MIGTIWIRNGENLSKDSRSEPNDASSQKDGPTPAHAQRFHDWKEKGVTKEVDVARRVVVSTAGDPKFPSREFVVHSDP